MLTKAEMRAFHPELQKTLERYFGFEVEILNGATVGGNRTMQELKAEREKERAAEKLEDYAHQIDSMTCDILNIHEQVEAAHEEFADLEGQKAVVRSELDSLQNRLLTIQEVDALNGQKTLTGALQGVEYADYEALKRTASKVDTSEHERGFAVTRAETAKNRASQADRRAEAVSRESPSAQLKFENAYLRGQLERMKRRLTDFMNRLPEQVREILRRILDDKKPNYPKKDMRQQRLVNVLERSQHKTHFYHHYADQSSFRNRGKY